MPAEVQPTAVSARLCRPAETRDLRRSVLRPGSSADIELPGDHVVGARHIGVFRGEQAVSACVTYPEPLASRPEVPAWRLRGMATDPAFQGCGYGALALELACSVIAEAGAELFWCHARDSAVGFYQRAGWTGEGELFDEIGIPHLLMVRAL